MRTFRDVCERKVRRSVKGDEFSNQKPPPGLPRRIQVIALLCVHPNQRLRSSESGNRVVQKPESHRDKRGGVASFRISQMTSRRGNAGQASSVREDSCSESVRDR